MFCFLQKEPPGPFADGVGLRDHVEEIHRRVKKKIHECSLEKGIVPVESEIAAV